MKWFAKIITVLIIINCLFLIDLSAQVGINNDGSSPNASAMLDVKSTNKGMLIPRMTTSQRDLITSPATGLMIYNNSTNTFNFYNGTAWIELTTGTVNSITDADSDTKIQVEKTADEDSIRIDIMGSERLVLRQNSGGYTMMSLPNSGSNTFIGEDAGRNTTNAAQNTFLGYQAGKANTSGHLNTFIGTSAGRNNTYGILNTFIGSLTGQNNTGGFNTFVGSQAGVSNTTGNSNVFIGMGTGAFTTTGSSNTFTGTSAGNANTTGQHNLFQGYTAGTRNVSDSNNTYLGYEAGKESTTGSSNIFLGYQAGWYELGSNKLYIENSNAATPLIYGDFVTDTVKIYGTLGIKDAFHFPIVDGTNGQILTTNGSGAVSWANKTVNTDNQTTDVFQLSGNSLQFSLENDGIATQSVDLSTIDNQKLDSFHLNGNTIELSIEDDGLAILSVDLSHQTSSMTRPLLLEGTTVGNGTYIEINNEAGTRAVLGADGSGLSGASTSDVTLANFSAGGLNFYANGAHRIIVKSDGKVGIGRTATTNLLEVNGQASKTSADSWIANSDARLKKNIQPLSSEKMLNDLLALQGVTYEWNDTITGNDRPTEIQYGFTAQNIQTVFPTLVEEDNLGFLQTAYGTYDAMTVEAIRALNDKIEWLEKENENLKVQVAKINKLEVMLLEIQSIQENVSSEK